MLKYKETKIKIFILNLTIRIFRRHKLFLAFSAVLLFVASFFLQGGQLTTNVLESVLLTTEIRQLGLVRPELLADAPDTGKLRPVDSALVSENSARTALIPLSITGPFALRNSDSEELRYFHQNIGSAGGSYSTNKVLHEEVWKFVDMFVIANQQGLEENFILKNSQFPAQFDFVVETVDLELHVDVDGKLQFIDQDGELEFTTAAPILTDVAGRQLGGELQNKIVWEVAEIEVIEEATLGLTDNVIDAEKDEELSSVNSAINDEVEISGNIENFNSVTAEVLATESEVSESSETSEEADASVESENVTSDTEVIEVETEESVAEIAEEVAEDFAAELESVEVPEEESIATETSAEEAVVPTEVQVDSVTQAPPTAPPGSAQLSSAEADSSGQAPEQAGEEIIT